ncbi:hypothetical protein [Streptomyces sp. NPDC006285]|uniref:hypothetical protein n=1 Tax=Streptomyces sp. NPDC006285 TaxID=3364742 RepID=UPI0036BF3579
MKHTYHRELIPRDEVLRLIGAINTMRTTFTDKAEQWQLLDRSGRVPAALSFTELFQHVTGAQELSHGVLRLTADFAARPYIANRAGRDTLAHLSRASTLSVQVAPHFAETAKTVLDLRRTSSPKDQQYVRNDMVTSHATARGYLRRTSESLRDATQALHEHLDLHRFFSSPALSDRPVPPPPGPKGHHR